MPTPLPALADGETLVATFTGNISTYVKEHVILAALGSIGAAGALIAMGDPNVWVGPLGATFAIAVRGFYVASEQVGMTWQLSDRRLLSPAGVTIPRSEIKTVRTIFSAAQVVTKSGEKYMIKYQADPKGVAETILSAQ